MGLDLQKHSFRIYFFSIGYQVMEKYLKDRKGRLMDDPGHYCKMATALAETIEVQKNIDSLFSKVEAAVID